MSGTGVASYGDLLVTSLVVLAGVCIAAFVVVRLLGRVLATGRVRGAHLLDVVARVPLEPRRSLYVVEVAGKTLLVGTSEMGLSVLSELDGGEVRARVVERPTFGELVKQAWARRKGVDKSSTRDGSAAGSASASVAGSAGSADGSLAGSKSSRLDFGQTGAASPAASDNGAEVVVASTLDRRASRTDGQAADGGAADARRSEGLSSSAEGDAAAASSFEERDADAAASSDKRGES